MGGRGHTLIGARSLPVQKNKNFFFLVSSNCPRISQNHRTMGLSSVYVSKRVPSLSAPKSRTGLPHTSSSSSSARNNCAPSTRTG